ncbi:conserved hypothetical protein [Cupriavidus phytorum]|uniref:TniQ domain-containing protein n=1 Tax=Cupriavidus taiwanensis TaxID=164546 RepID=A0A975WPE6_9BURK|nr:conserved hypothetical protein [Cupriavidus taiwanensis]
MFSLAVRVVPMPDEGLVGYVSRLEGANALGSGELVRRFRSMSDEELSSIFAAGTYPSGWTQELAEIRRPSTRPARVWNHRIWKYCPPCLRLASYWRNHWSLTLVSCCPLHSTRLMDHCSKCGKSIDRRVLLDFRCDECAQPLADGIAVTTQSRGALWLATELASRLDGAQRDRMEEVRALGLTELHELALRLGIRASHTQRVKPLKVRDASRVAIALPIARDAGEILMTWPAGMKQLIGRLCIQAPKESRWRIQKAVGPLYRDVYRYLDGPSFNFVRKAFEAYVGEEWRAPLARRNRNFPPSVVQRHGWLSLGKAASRLALPPSLLFRLVDSGELRALEIKHKSGKVSRSVDLNELSAARNTLRSALSLRQASRSLGIGLERVRQLLDAGLLRAIAGRPRPGERWWIDREKLPVPENRKRRKRKEVDSESVTVADIAKYLVPDANTFVALIGAIWSGSLSAGVGADPVRIGEWRLDREEVATWMLERHKTETISLVEAAARLGVKQEVVYALSRAKILMTNVVRVGRRQAQTVSNSSLSDFGARYVFGTELARLAGTSPRHLARRLLAMGIHAVAGPGVNNCMCRQYVWERSQQTLDVAMNTLVGKPHERRGPGER